LTVKSSCRDTGFLGGEARKDVLRNCGDATPGAKDGKPATKRSAILADERAARNRWRIVGGKEHSILVIEDDPSIVSGLESGLGAAGFEVAVARGGDEGYLRALAERFDLIVLDLMLPDCSGLDVLGSWKGQMTAPVIVLTARTDLGDRLEAFRLGAVDYVPKPFWIEELVARIRTRLAGEASVPRKISWEDVTVDLEGRTASVGGQAAGLTQHEFDLLAYLLERSGRAVSRSHLAQEALPLLGDRDERTVDSHIARIRKKLGKRGARHLVTVWGIGYRFDPGEIAD
jgi:DNA-binding response OmpR family regulator